MRKAQIDIDQLLEETKALGKNTAPIEYIPVEIDRLLNETDDTEQMHE